MCTYFPESKQTTYWNHRMVDTNKPNGEQEIKSPHVRRSIRSGDSNSNSIRSTRNRSSSTSRRRRSNHRARQTRPSFRSVRFNPYYGASSGGDAAAMTTVGGCNVSNHYYSSSFPLSSLFGLDDDQIDDDGSSCRITKLMKVLDDALEILDQDDFVATSTSAKC